MEEKNKVSENHFWSGFFLGAALGAGVVYFLQENNPERKEKLMQVVRDLLDDNYRGYQKESGEKAQIVDVAPPNKTAKRTFRRHGKAL